MKTPQSTYPIELQPTKRLWRLLAVHDWRAGL